MKSIIHKQSKNNFRIVSEILSLVVLIFCLVQPFSATAQFSKLLDKAKSAVSGGGSAGKKSGNFATIWEAEFDNKATRLAANNGDGSYVIGTDENSATVLDGTGKVIWSGDFKKITTNKTNKCEYQNVIWKGLNLIIFPDRIPCIKSIN